MIAPEKIDVRDAVVAITGSGRGIGRATAEAFVRAGARVAIGDLDAAAAQATAGEIGARARAYELDVTDLASFRRFRDDVEKDLGPLDVLVNNAGIMPVGSFLNESIDVAITQTDVNYWGVYYGMRLAAERMISRRRGHIVNITSGAGKFVIPGVAGYCAAKSAATALSVGAGEELRKHGVTVTAVLPVAVNTQLTDGIPLKHVPNALRRFIIIEPHQVAEVIVDSVRRRPVLTAAPRWVTPLLAAVQLVPQSVIRLLLDPIATKTTLGEIDRSARAEYDGRITRQLDTDAAKLTSPGAVDRSSHGPQRNPSERTGSEHIPG